MQIMVAVSDATVYYDKLYTYAVPAPLQERVFVGSLVLVPFGRGKTRPRIGVAIEIAAEDRQDGRIKQIWDVAPEEAALSDELLAIVRYLKEATFCTWYEAVRAALPYGAQYRVVQNDGQWALQAQVQRHTQQVYAAGDTAQTKKISAKQQAVLDCLRDGPVPRKELLEASGVGLGVLQTMVKNGLLLQDEQDKVLEVETEAAPQVEKQPLPVLTAAQNAVVQPLLQQMNRAEPQPSLLYGVTGSGKTPVFLHLAMQALQQGKGAMILVPEIGLTPQMLRQMRAIFGQQVAVLHSGLSNTERFLQWRRIRRGEAPVVVGTRSAVFAPLQNIGVLIVDEEQEHTYQSESAPRYDAVQVAKRRAARHGALLLLASATPAVADYYAAKQGKYQLFTLWERYGELPLPSVEMVDMREELMLGNASTLSKRLLDEIDATIQAGRQVILLLNRRGYQTVGMCRNCGTVIKCGDCSVPMVYHKAGERLLCHYCGKSESPVPHICAECGGEIRYTGFGTQHAEEELTQRFPNTGILRMDMDSTSKKGAHGRMLSSFGRGEYDILLGTQMVAKGLDFEKVSLVGVIGIDSLLFSQGYRAYENVFSLVTQVVGRAGRAGMPGHALIQTVDPQNPVLELAADQDYEAFYDQEIMFRKMGLYPPFCTLCTVGFVAKTEEDALAASRRFSQLLAGLAKAQTNMPLHILGPAPMQVMQVAGVYRYRLTLKCRMDAAFRALARRALEVYNEEKWPLKASAYFDFNADGGA